MKSISFLASLLLGLSAASSSAAIIAMNLEGKGGIGLLSTNENHVVSGLRTGGESGAGISYDDVLKELTINVSWSTALGFTGLTGNASAGHIHGRTTAPLLSPAPASFTENAGVLFGLDSGPTWDPSATSGGITGRVVTLNAAQETELLAGKFYINIHTGANGSGELRGNIVIPEASTALLSAIGALGLFARKRR